MNIYVGNVSYSTTEDSIRGLFEAHGMVATVKLISDRETGRKRGFGFVEMPNDQEAQAAIAAINGTQHDGRTLNVKEARPKEAREPREPREYRGPRGGGGGGEGRGGNRRFTRRNRRDNRDM